MYNGAGCLFCKIIRGELPAAKVYEDDHTLSFLDIHPTNQGHTLVVPKEHHQNIYETPEEVLCDVMRVVKKLSPIIKKALRADGINVIMNNDPAAGQIIFHAHIHIVPRFSDDGFRQWKGTPYGEGKIDEVAKQRRNAISGGGK